MKAILSLLVVSVLTVSGYSQYGIPDGKEVNDNLVAEVAKLKEVIRQLQETELQSDKARYQRNYKIIVNGIEIIKEMQQGVMEISGARTQNILYKKLIDINNPTSEALGFQLQDVVLKTLEDNIGLIPLAEPDRKRLRGQTSDFFEGLKRTFPPVQLLTGIFSGFSSFNTYKARVERMGRKADSLIVDVTNPITRDFLLRFNGQLQPYIVFYNELDKINNSFENALYQHEIEYRDYLEEIRHLQEEISKKVNLSGSASEQVIALFDLTNSSAADFNFKAKGETEEIKELVGYCLNVFEMVDRYKKFTNDFIIIQDDFYRSNLAVLNKTAKSLPIKDNSKIDQLAEDLNQLKNGNPSSNTAAFDASYKQRLKSILAKLYAINRLRA
ncbi:MAG TPA: hypothetical protein VF476_02425 [Chitinophagaceae bacterium]